MNLFEFFVQNVWVLLSLIFWSLSELSEICIIDLPKFKCKQFIIHKFRLSSNSVTEYLSTICLKLLFVFHQLSISVKLKVIQIKAEIGKTSILVTNENPFDVYPAYIFIEYNLSTLCLIWVFLKKPYFCIDILKFFLLDIANSDGRVIGILVHWKDISKQ